MNEGQSKLRQRCEAMKDAGIEDPESEEGILFCAGSRDGKIESCCPYEYCVVFETKRPYRVDDKANFAKALRKHGVSIDDVALILHSCRRTILRYLKR